MYTHTPFLSKDIYSLQVGDTALHMASTEGHEEVVRLLLQSGVRDIANKVRKYFYSYSIFTDSNSDWHITVKCAQLCTV